MTELTATMYQIFDQPEFSFKKIKEQYSPAEVDALKAEFKTVWQTWKAANQTVAANLPAGLFAKVHVESRTNGWNLRDHYWASYRLAVLADANPCIGVMLDRKQFQVYLMFQHYKSDHRQGTPAEYNQLLAELPDWSKGKDLTNWYLWDKDEMEFADHLPLRDYLADEKAREEFNQEAKKTSFLVGKFAFRNRDQVPNMEQFILEAIEELVPLYEKLL